MKKYFLNYIEKAKIIQNIFIKNKEKENNVKNINKYIR